MRSAIDHRVPHPGRGTSGVRRWHITLTLLHPTARGRLSDATNRLTGTVARALSLRVLRGRWLSYAGPLAVAGDLLGWVLCLWVGYALVYLPFIGSFSFDRDTPFAGEGLFEALYVSGTSLTTVGFGDVVATGTALRLSSSGERLRRALRGDRLCPVGPPVDHGAPPHQPAAGRLWGVAPSGCRPSGARLRVRPPPGPHAGDDAGS